MFFWKKKYSVAETGLLEAGIDCHSHLLWGVDDGIRTAEDAMTCLNMMEEVGLQTQWFTPHIMEDVPNEEETLKTRFEAFKSEYAAAESPSGRKVELRLGAEYMLDNLFTERLARGGLLTTYDAESLLIETSSIFPPLNMDSTIESIRQKGYRPILAHPERYLYMKEEDYRALYYKGVLLQLNLPSLIGAYGPMEKAKAKWLLEKNLYYFYGTDTHRPVQMRNALHSKCLTSKMVNQILLLKR